MYSSYGNQRRNANILRFIPPGFKFPIDVQFPPRCLPVCERCKKNFKTREHCRGRDCHTDLAWCETYVCVSLDNTCTGDDGFLLDGPFVAKVVPPIAFNLKGELNPLTPICAPCKDKNYTRTYCRQNKNHRQLPWSTVYVIVSLKAGTLPVRTEKPSINKRIKSNSGDCIPVDSAVDDSASDLKRKNEKADDDATADNSNYGLDLEGEDEESDPQSKTDDGEEVNRKDIKEESGKESSSSKKKTKKRKSKDANTNDEKDGDEDEEDLEKLKAIEAVKLDDIPRSRTFLATVSSKLHRIEWVDIDPVLETQLPMLNENHPDNHVNDVYDMRNSNPMMHPSMSRNMGIESAGMGGMNEMGNMRGMNSMNRMRPQQGGGMSMGAMNPNGSNNVGMSAGNVPSSYLNEDPRAGMEPQMMGGQMSRLGAQDMMSQMQMRQMELRHMSQMNQMQMEGMGGAIPFETQSMPGRMSFGGGTGGTGFTSPQEMIQYEQAMRSSRDMAQAQMSFDRNRMMSAGMPFNSMGQSDFGSQMTMDRMGMSGGHDMMSRPGMSGGGSDMMGMSRTGAGVGLPGQDMMRNMGSGQDMMRTSAFERMSMQRGMGGQEMMGVRGGMNMGISMGGQEMAPQSWRGMNDQSIGPIDSGAYGQVESDAQDRNKQGIEKEKEI